MPPRDSSCKRQVTTGPPNQMYSRRCDALNTHMLRQKSWDSYLIHVFYIARSKSFATKEFFLHLGWLWEHILTSHCPWPILTLNWSSGSYESLPFRFASSHLEESMLCLCLLGNIIWASHFCFVVPTVPGPSLAAVAPAGVFTHGAVAFTQRH